MTMVCGKFSTAIVDPPDEGWGAHRYWRLALSGVNGAAQYNFTRLVMALTTGGSDIIISSGATVTASGSGADAFGHDVSKLTDANDLTGWNRGSIAGTVYLTSDFGTAKAIAEARIRTEQFWDYTPTSVVLAYSDDNVSFTDAETVTFGSSWVQYNERSIPDPHTSGYYRMWRVYMLDNNGGGVMGTVEMEMRDGISGTDQVPPGVADGAAGRTIRSSAFSIPAEAYKAFDDNTGTYWISSAGAVTNQYLGFVFPNDVIVPECSIYDGGANPPNHVEVQASHDGTTWDVIRTATLGAWPVTTTKVF